MEYSQAARQLLIVLSVVPIEKLGLQVATYVSNIFQSSQVGYVVIKLSDIHADSCR